MTSNLHHKESSYVDGVLVDCFEDSWVTVDVTLEIAWWLWRPVWLYWTRGKCPRHFHGYTDYRVTSAMLLRL